MKPLSPSELLVCRVVEATLPGVRLERADFNEGHAQHDFDLVRAGAPFAALEVTEDRDEADAQWRALGEPVLPVPRCASGWQIHLWDVPRLPNKWAAAELAPLLQNLEAAGSAEHTVYPNSPSDLETPESLRELGYVAAVRDPKVKAGNVKLIRAGWGEPVSSTVELAGWIEAFTSSDRCQGERAKLASSGFDETHLSIVIPFVPGSGRRVFDLMTSIASFGPPNTAVNLPPEIVSVWLVSDYPGVPSLSVSQGGWAVTQPARPAS